ncbi:MAG: dihydroorotate dehydrogenase [Firmicutes bacterium]|nr:dihydroorotate dehydrogenase [Bacillota bacterium]
MAELAVKLPGMELKNPLIPASGTFGYGMDHLDFFDVNECGSFSMKGTTLEPREGNALPRIAECAGGMLNAVGLQNPGAREVIESVFPELRKIYRGKIFANVSGFSVEEYAECARLLAAEDIVGAIELNISCPNVHGGGMSFGTDPKTAAEVLRAVKKTSDKPVYVKCTPQCPDLPAMCEALEEAGADGLVLLNTFLGMRLDYRTGKPVLANVTGGVSGPGIFPLALQRIYQISPRVSIPIIGCGGVCSGRDVIEMMSAGASAVEIGTSNLIDPMSVPRIKNELEAALEELGIDDINEIIGRAFK